MDIDHWSLDSIGHDDFALPADAVCQLSDRNYLYGPIPSPVTSECVRYNISQNCASVTDSEGSEAATA